MSELGLYCRLIVLYIKTLGQSKVDFFLGIFAFLVNQFFSILFLYLIFLQIPMLSGWTFEQMLFVFGLALVTKGIDHMFTDSLWDLAWYKVKTGLFDRYLLRPMNIFFQIVSEQIQFDGLGESVLGIILISYSVKKGIICLSKINILLLVVSIFCGALIITSMKLVCASMSFWFKESGYLLQMLYQLIEFTKYPIDIYLRPIKIIVTFAVPVAFVSYYPALYFLGRRAGLSTLVLELVVATILWKVAISVFLCGVNRYESSGN